MHKESLLSVVLFTLFTLQLAVHAEDEKLVRATAGSSCALTRSLSLGDMVDQAAIVFRGKFVDFKDTVNQHGISVRRLKFRVKEPIRGIAQYKKFINIDMWAQIRSPFTPEMIAADEEYVFFFREPSRKDLSSPVGMEQGLAKVTPDNKLVYASRLALKAQRNRSKFLFFKQTDTYDENDLDSYEELKNFVRL